MAVDYGRPGERLGWAGYGRGLAALAQSGKPPAGEPVTIAGQLCTPKDVLARDLPVARIRAGDLIAFGLAGAYAWNISHHDFLMHPPPAFHHLPETR